MRISQVETVFKPTSFPPAARPPLVLVAGQRLTAEVTAAFPEQKLLQLSVGDYQLRAQTGLNLAPGRTVELEVVSGGALPVLKLLPPTTTHAVSTAMRQALPAQVDPQEFYIGLLDLLPLADQMPSLSGELLAKIEALVKNLPTLSTLINPDGLAQALAQSGLFMEAKLARPGKGGLEGDFKANLLRLLLAVSEQGFSSAETSSERGEMAFQQATAGLRGKAEGAIAKLLLDQLSSLPKQDDGAEVWHFNLPFLHEGAVHSTRLVVERRASGSPEKPRMLWSMLLELNPEALGVIRCKLLCSDATVSIHFQCEQASTTRLIDGALDALRQRLSRAGLVLGNLHASTGSQPLPALSLLPASLVDVRA